MKPNDLPSDIDERLWEWATYFRDYRPTGRCASLEGRYKRHSDDLAEEVSEDVRETPKKPRPLGWELRAIETHEVIQQLDRRYKWALTYAFCYPSLPRFVVLRCMKKYTGRRMNWKLFQETLDIGRMRVWTFTTGFSEETLVECRV